jgi:hypothetical protein
VISRSGESKGGILQSTGSVFEGDSGKRYAKSLEGVVGSVAGVVGECVEGVSRAVFDKVLEGRGADKVSRMS